METPLTALPAYWQEQIRQLRVERAELRKLVDTREVRRLRQENAKTRVQRNEARAEVARLRAELAR